jgi:hypothetical protein
MALINPVSRRRFAESPVHHYLVGKVGTCMARSIDRKESRGRAFLFTEGGFNHHLSASENFDGATSSSCSSSAPTG